MKFIKNNFLIIIVFLIVLIISFYFPLKNKKLNDNDYFEQKEFYDKRCSDFSDIPEELIPNIKENCIELSNELKYMENPNFYDKYIYFIEGDSGIVFDFIVMLVLTITTLYGLNKIFYDKVVLNYLIKESYPKFKRKLFLKAYRYIFIFPIILLLLILFFFSYTNLKTIPFERTTLDLIKLPLMMPRLNLVFYVLNAFVVSGICINIALMSLRYKHNYFIVVLVSLVSYICLSMIINFGIGNLLIKNILLYDKIGFNEVAFLFNINSLFDIKLSMNPPLYTFLMHFAFFLISWLGVFVCYRNKEKLVISCEKNMKEEEV